MDQSEYEPSLDTIAPRIAAIWKDVLDRDNIGMDEHFLDLGGDSLQAMLCASKIHQAFGTELVLQDFFHDDATVLGMAKTVQQDVGQR